MYIIIGTTITFHQESYDSHLEEEKSETVVATFDTEEKAEEYLKAAQLKQPRGDKMFLSNSPLSPYISAEIVEYEEPIPPPHNPEVKWKKKKIH